MKPNSTRPLLATILCMISQTGIAQPHTPTPSLRIEAVDRSGMLADSPETRLFIGAAFNGWNPSGTKQDGWLVSKNGDRIGWFFSIPKKDIEHGGEFKFTRGNWQTVEVSERGLTIENRRTGVPDWNTTNPVLRLEVQGFEDQRTDTAVQQSTVTGTLDIWTIQSDALGTERVIRVWLPEAYATSPDRAFGVFYMHDGQNLFDKLSAAFGVEWQADETATTLIQSDAIEPVIIVGLDNGGTSRSLDYLPFSPGSDAPHIQGGGADDYLRFMTQEVMPEIAERYRVLEGPQHTGLGGSSFGGVITLHAIMTMPGVFGTALVESPSLWVGDGKLIHAIKSFDGPWPQRIFMGMGDRESGNATQDQTTVRLAESVAKVFTAKGLGPDRFRLVIGKDHRHNESAWQSRLPGALRFLLGDTPEHTGQKRAEP